MVHMIKRTTRATIRTESTMIHTTHATVSTCILHILHHAYIYILYEYMFAFARMCACVSVSSCLSTRVCIYTHFACMHVPCMHASVCSNVWLYMYVYALNNLRRFGRAYPRVLHCVPHSVIVHLQTAHDTQRIYFIACLTLSACGRTNM